MAHLSPRKQKLYAEIKTLRKAKQTLQKSLKSKKKMFNVRNSAKLLTDSRFKILFEHLSPSAKILILSQLKSKKKKRNWSKEEKALFLAMYKSSPKGYRFLSKVIKLPSKRTLQRTLNCVLIKPGINEKILNYLAVLSNKKNLKERYCSIIFDEIYLQPHLSLNLKSFSIEGLQNLGGANSKNIADHALVFMLRGINAKWKQPLAYYFVKSSIKTFELKSLLKQII